MNIQWKLTIFAGAIVLVNGIMGYSFYQSNKNLNHSQRWVQHTEQVISESGHVLCAAKDIEASSRGFVITNDSSFLSSFWPVHKNVFQSTRRLKELVSDNAIQQQNTDSMNYYLHLLVNYSLSAINTRSKQRYVAANDEIAALAGKYNMEQLLRIIGKIQLRETALLEERLQVNEHRINEYNRQSVLMYLLLAICNIGLLVLARNYLVQNKNKEERAAELVIANGELAYENIEKGVKAAELIVANKELEYENKQKSQRAAELITANGELAYENVEKEKRAAELVIANEELAYENKEKKKRAEELAIAYGELAFENREKGKRAAELAVANEALLYESNEKGKRAAELAIANTELAHENQEKQNRADELVIANKDLLFENTEKGKRAAELAVANEELAYENNEKEKRAAELAIANEELLYESKEKEDRAAELLIANNELAGSQEIARYGNFRLDYATGATYWSEQLCKIFGVAKEDNERSYKSLLAFIHPDDCKHVMKVTTKANTDVNFYHRIIWPDGSVKHLHTWQRIETDETGAPVSMHIVAHDITDQTANVITLKAQNKQLREIAWIQSHRVRGPLATILGLAEMFKDKPTKEETDIILQGIFDSAEKLDKVIRDIVIKTSVSDIQ